MSKITIINSVGQIVEKLSWFPPFKQVINYTKSQNLGQTYHGVPNYKTIDDNYNNAGIGYSFEDLTALKWKLQGDDVKQVPPTLNGADFIRNGEPCQLKCGINGCKSAQHLYKRPYGEYKYPGQSAVVPKGQLKMAEKTVSIRKNLGLGSPDNIIESPVSRQESLNNVFRGWDSIYMDLKDPHVVKPCVYCGFAFAALGAAIDFSCHHKKMNKKKKIKRSLSWLAGGAVVSGLFILGSCSYRQLLRPCK